MAESRTDTNLLYGLLALNADYITRDQMIEAMQTWMLDKSRTLDDILVSKGFLKQRRRELLGAIVADHVAEHDGDVHKSLAAVGVDVLLCEQLSDDLQDPELHASLSQVSVSQFRTVPPEAGPSTSEGRRFKVMRLHARGGLGQVYVANDTELHREVALKEMREKIADDPVRRQNFVLEAEITGGLEHPGIVPVYGLGKAADGRPYYAMRFIRGGELTDSLKEFHQQDVEDPDSYALELHNLVRRLVACCNAIGYAHSRGVLHRDLKPRNIMLGRFGETLVVDWGLAMLSGLAAEESDFDQGMLQPPSASGTATQQMGSLVGTVQYMAPEQASGNVQLISVATDVYGLGATLYEVVTGRPPIIERDVRAAIEMAKKGSFPNPRKVNPRVPPPLEAICLKAMSRHPKDRYPSAIALAEDLEKWMADHPVSAYSENWRELAARWMRRNWSRVQAATIALVAIAFVSTVAAISTLRAKEAEREAKNLALVNFRQARDAVDSWLTGPAEDLKEYPDFRRHILTKAAEDYEQFSKQSSEDVDVELERARTLLRLGQLRGMLQEAESAESCLRQSESLLSELLRRSSLHEVRLELGNSRTSLANLFLDLEKFDPARKLYDAAIASHRQLRNEVSVPEHIAALAISLTNKGRLLLRLDLLDEAQAELEQAISEFKQAITSKPDDADYRIGLSVATEMLATVLERKDQREAAESLFWDAINDVTRQINENHDNIEAVRSRANARLLLSDILSKTGRYGDCQQLMQSALADYQFLADCSPDNPKCIESVANARTQLGQILFRLGKTKEAKVELDIANGLLADLVESNQLVPRYREGLAICDDNLAQLLMELDQNEEAKAYGEAAIVRLDKLTADVQPLRTYRHRTAIALSHLGQIQHRLGRYPQAHEYFQQAISIMAALLDEKPDAMIENDIAHAYAHWGALFWDEDNTQSSKLALQNALNRWRNLADITDLPAYRHDLARLLIMCVAPELRAPKEAVDHVSKALAAAPYNADYASTLGAALFRAGDLNAAKEQLETAIALRGHPQCFELFFSAMTFSDLGDSEQAMARYQSAVSAFEEHQPGNLGYQRLRLETLDHLTATKNP